jgi:hypothetical protein
MEKMIETPFGPIDLDYTPIELTISANSQGFPRIARYEGIQSNSENGQYATLSWRIWQYDKEGNLLPDREFVQGREVRTEVSGNNRVTPDGITIKREGFPEGEVGDRAFQMAWNAGHNEYRFWMAVLYSRTLPEAVKAAGMILAQYGVFD